MTEAELIAGLARDACGLTGSILVAVPFFSLEERKQRAKLVREARTPDADLAAQLDSAGEILATAVITPVQRDSAFTLAGLVLLAFSFGLSLLLTVHDYRSH